MSRPLRIEYEGAWYHVMNRGANRGKIFLDQEHYQIFLNLLAEVSVLFAVEIHAYCLMGNHYHLLLHTPKGNISRVMRHLDGVYTQRFNRLTKRDGPLFRGRYKALLIEKDSYLLQVSRYIHLNPVAKSDIKKAAYHYKWSSYAGYLDMKTRPEWLHTEMVLGQVDGALAYCQYVSCGVDEEIANIYDKKFYPAILGSKTFKLQCLEKLNSKKVEESGHDIKRSKDIPTINELISKAAVYFEIEVEEIVRSKRGRENIPRMLVMYICRHIYGYKIREIAFCLCGIKLGALSTAIERTKRRLHKDLELQRLYYQLLDAVS